MKQLQCYSINLVTVSLRIIMFKEIASNTCLHYYQTPTYFFFFFTFRHLVTFHARLNDFGSVRFGYEHNYIACFSICTTMQFMVVYETIAYIGLNSSAVDHSVPQSEKAHIKTPVHLTVALRSGLWFGGNITQYAVSVSGVESFFKNTAVFFFFFYLTWFVYIWIYYQTHTAVCGGLKALHLTFSIPYN